MPELIEKLREKELFMQVNIDVVYPVILPVAHNKQSLKGREMVRYLSSHARHAVEISARKNGVFLINLSKNENGAPIPFNGNHWSLTHKPEYVAGVTAAKEIGIDLEKMRPCRDSLFKKIANNKEWDLIDGDRSKKFFRYWTSKEAALKAAGKGLSDLSKCRVIEVIDNYNLVVSYRGKKIMIEHFFFDGHIASVVKDSFHVEWGVIPV